jgi:hypothetical protein
MRGARQDQDEDPGPSTAQVPWYDTRGEAMAEHCLCFDAASRGV